jgi:hypothetical protein
MNKKRIDRVKPGHPLYGQYSLGWDEGFKFAYYRAYGKGYRAGKKAPRYDWEVPIMKRRKKIGLERLEKGMPELIPLEGRGWPTGLKKPKTHKLIDLKEAERLLRLLK